MRSGWTTICCSALALTLASTPLAAAEPQLPPLALFPVRLAWTLPLNTTLAAPPAFDGSRGFFPIDGHRLVAYDLEAGTQLWTASARTTSPPVAGDGLIVLVEPDGLTALHQADGTTAWRLPFTDELAVALAVADGWLIAATTDGDVHAIRAADGVLVWRKAIGTRLAARPSVAGDRLFLPVQNDRVLALTLGSGEPIWERRLGGPPNDIVARGDRVYVGSNDNYFYCLKADEGAVDWRWRTGGDVVGSAAIEDDWIFFVSLDNVLRGHDRTSGNQRWMRLLPLRPTTGVLPAGTAVVVGGLSPTLRGFAMLDGAPAGEIALEGVLTARPHVVQRTRRALPMIVAVTTDIAKGAVVKAFERSIEPTPAPIAPLPNAIALPAVLGAR